MKEDVFEKIWNEIAEADHTIHQVARKYWLTGNLEAIQYIQAELKETIKDIEEGL